MDISPNSEQVLLSIVLDEIRKTPGIYSHLEEQVDALRQIRNHQLNERIESGHSGQTLSRLFKTTPGLYSEMKEVLIRAGLDLVQRNVTRMSERRAKDQLNDDDATTAAELVRLLETLDQFVRE